MKVKNSFLVHVNFLKNIYFSNNKTNKEQLKNICKNEPSSLPFLNMTSSTENKHLTTEFVSKKKRDYRTWFPQI